MTMIEVWIAERYTYDGLRYTPVERVPFLMPDEAAMKILDWHKQYGAQGGIESITYKVIDDSPEWAKEIQILLEQYFVKGEVGGCDLDCDAEETEESWCEGGSNGDVTEYDCYCRNHALKKLEEVKSLNDWAVSEAKRLGWTK